ncbi:Hypothetical_protein [Hexamita inflata]|uniref:Hypothetical_protein n=1 Tax=Hexamita inflata TaxID=28002 RepID=A0AA86QKM6_9EUKA|nr:Hypothetical protein HINF_LOCUS42549 [Hexamita inflata]
MQLKRYDRCYQFLASTFVIFFVNLAFQIITFSIRNVVYKAIFQGEFDETFTFYHCCLDGLLGTFNAFTMAVIKSESTMRVGLVLGSVKMLLSVGFYLVGYYVNKGMAHFSSFVYYYKYCVDVLGFGFFILYFIKFYKLKKYNQDNITQSKNNSIAQINNSQLRQQNKSNNTVVRNSEPRLVLQQMQPIDNLSRNTSTENTTESKSKEQSDVRASKYDVIYSQNVSDDKQASTSAPFIKQNISTEDDPVQKEQKTSKLNQVQNNSNLINNSVEQNVSAFQIQNEPPKLIFRQTNTSTTENELRKESEDRKGSFSASMFLNLNRK